jgi:hypothetical protein
VKRAALLVVAACGGSNVTAEVQATRPVTLDQATAFADAYVAAIQKCDPEQLDALVDEHAVAARVLATADLSDTLRDVIGNGIPARHEGAKLICASEKEAVNIRVLHIPVVDGRPRPILRRVQKSARTGVSMVAYEQLELGAGADDGTVRAVDVYWFITGEWLSDGLAEAYEAASAVGGKDAIGTLAQFRQAKQLRKDGKPADALALIDQMPASFRDTRSILLFRVGVAHEVSDDAYLQALDELAAKFPDDPSLALAMVDGAILRKDYDAALHYTQVVDAAIGHDAWQDAIRAIILTRRGTPADLIEAARLSRTACDEEPTLAKPWWSRLDVDLARQDFSDALDTMDQLSQRFGAPFTDAALRTEASYAGLLATPEYAAWQAKRGNP